MELSQYEITVGSFTSSLFDKKRLEHLHRGLTAGLVIANDNKDVKGAEQITKAADIVLKAIQTPANRDIEVEVPAKQAQEVMMALYLGFELLLVHDLDEETARGYEAAFDRAFKAMGCRKVNRGSRVVYLPVDIWVVVLNENEEWEVPEHFKPYVQRFQSVYFFDRNSVTHLCSVEGSYWCQHLEDRAEWVEGMDEDVYEEIRDKVDNYIYGVNCSESNYRDERQMEKFLAQHKGDKSRVHHYGNPMFDWAEVEEEVETDNDEDRDNEVHEKIMEAVEENLRGNSVI